MPDVGKRNRASRHEVSDAIHGAPGERGIDVAPSEITRREEDSSLSDGDQDGCVSSSSRPRLSTSSRGIDVTQTSPASPTLADASTIAERRLGPQRQLRSRKLARIDSTKAESNEDGSPFSPSKPSPPTARSPTNASSSSSRSTASTAITPATHSPTRGTAEEATSGTTSSADAEEARRTRKKEGAREHRRKFANNKNCIKYQLTLRPSMAQTWQDHLVQRAEAVTDARRRLDGGETPNDFISRDVGQPWTPLPCPRVGVNDESQETPNDTLRLPFSSTFQSAPIIGEDTDANILVKSADGFPLLQRISAPNAQKAPELQAAATSGRDLQASLFASAMPRSSMGEAEEVECGSTHREGSYGWTPDHQANPTHADAMLHWAWRFFHKHVYPLATLLHPELRSDLDSRRDSYEWLAKLMGPTQCSLTHHWWLTAVVSRGYQTLERVDEGQSHQPIVMVGFEDPYVIFIAHHDGFFKTVVRPGQVVVLRGEFPYQIHPWEDDVDAASHVEQRQGEHCASSSSSSGSRSRSSSSGSKGKASQHKAPRDHDPRHEDVHARWAVTYTFPHDTFLKKRSPSLTPRLRLDPLPLQPDADEQRGYIKHPHFARKPPGYGF